MVYNPPPPQHTPSHSTFSHPTPLQDYIQRLMAEKADLDKRFHGMKDELITRLQNACTQRDEARATVSVKGGRGGGWRKGVLGVI